MAIIGISAALVALTYPLNRMVGRTFVPNEDMAEFTVHADTPQGTSIEGTTEIAQNVVREIGEQEGVSHVTYLAGADRYTHFHVFFYLLPVDGADRHPGAGDRARAQGPGAAPGLQRDGAGAKPARRRRRQQRASQAVLLGPGHRQALRLFAADSREGARRRRAWSTRRPTTAMPVPRCRSPVDRARAADLGVRMATVGNTLRLMVAGDDEISTYREAGEQYPVKIRVLESQRRDIDDRRQAHRDVAVRAAGADRQHRPDDPGLRTDAAVAVEPAVFASISTPTWRRATRSTRRRTTCGGSSPTSRCRRDTASGCRVRPGISTRRPTTW